MSVKNKRITLMFQHAQKNPSFAVKLGMSLNDVDKIVTIGNAEGFDFTKEQFLGHLKAVANENENAPRNDWFGNGPTSSAMGEEDKKPRPDHDDGHMCTMAIPEESKPRSPEKDKNDGMGHMVTLAIPEESRPRTPREDFEDLRPTTLAMGEEERKPRRPSDEEFGVTTCAVGEEDKKPRLPENPKKDEKKKDLAPPKHPPMTTLAVGEEGKGPRK